MRHRTGAGTVLRPIWRSPVGTYRPELAVRRPLPAGCPPRSGMCSGGARIDPDHGNGAAEGTNGPGHDLDGSCAGAPRRLIVEEQGTTTVLGGALCHAP